MKYIITGKYDNGDNYFDRFDTLQEVKDHIEYLYSTDNASQRPENRLNINNVNLETEKD